MPKTLPARAALCVAAALAWVGWGKERTSEPGAEIASALVPAVLPERPTSHPPPPIAPPALLPQLENPVPLTAELETRYLGRPGGAVQRKTITRTADRVHISFGPKAPQWLFVRNAADRRRVAGTMVDHDHRTVIEYDASELRNGGLGRGWADIASIGVEPEAFANVTPTGKQETLAGFQFQQMQRRNDAQGRIREVWWSEEAAMPLRVTIDDGPSGMEVVVRTIRREVDESLLRDPRERYAGYTVMDIADYREKHHEDERH